MTPDWTINERLANRVRHHGRRRWIEVITGVGRRRRAGEGKVWIAAESLDPATTVPAVGSAAPRYAHGPAAR